MRRVVLGTQEEIEELLNSASEEVEQVLAAVFHIERAKLYLSQPQGIVDEVTDSIRAAVT